MIYTTPEIARAALDHYGNAHQIRKAVEECGELVAALMQYDDGRVADEAVITEIADVSIMMEQLALLFGKARVFDEICRKESRLLKRIKE